MTADVPRSNPDQVGVRPITCIWCGRVHRPRSTDDLEVWARLCPECLGRAQDNEFLRFRLRDALAARARATRPAAAVEPIVVEAASTGSGPGDDWYLRQGSHARGPILDVAWQAELDTVTRWLDAQPMAGRIVELAAGSGWWSPLLAGRGELWVTDPSGEALDLARARLVAHGLRAHLHVRDPWARPDGQADVLLAAFWIGRIARQRFADAARLAHDWLSPGGMLLLIDSVDEPFEATAPLDPGELGLSLRAAGFHDVTLERSGRFFLVGRARA